MRVLVDTNVLLDFFLNRQPFSNLLNPSLPNKKRAFSQGTLHLSQW